MVQRTKYDSLTHCLASLHERQYDNAETNHASQELTQQCRNGREEAKRLLYFSIRSSVCSELLPRYSEELLGKSEATLPYAPPFALTSLRSAIMRDVLLEGVIHFQDQIRRLATLSQVVRSDRDAVSVVRGDGKPAHSNDDQEETNKARACDGRHEMLFSVSAC